MLGWDCGQGYVLLGLVILGGLDLWVRPFHMGLAYGQGHFSLGLAYGQDHFSLGKAFFCWVWPMGKAIFHWVWPMGRAIFIGFGIWRPIEIT